MNGRRAKTGPPDSISGKRRKGVIPVENRKGVRIGAGHNSRNEPGGKMIV
jgi:hypothetical protein